MIITRAAYAPVLRFTGRRPIQTALMITLLLSMGCRSKETQLRWAANRGDSTEVAHLLSHGARIDVQDQWENTALSFAARNCHPAVVRLLVAHGAQVDKRIGLEGNALHAAAIGGCAEVLEILLAHGAELCVRDLCGHTPGTLAIGSGDRDAVKVLRRAATAEQCVDLFELKVPSDEVTRCHHLDQGFREGLEAMGRGAITSSPVPQDAAGYVHSPPSVSVKRLAPSTSTEGVRP
jgi:hypothetical protein